MSSIPPEAPPAPPAAPAPGSPPAGPGSPATRRPMAGLAVSLALGAALLSLLVTGMLWQRLGQTQQELARRSQDVTLEVAQAKTKATEAESLVNELQARLSVAELRLSEVSLQRSQLEELMLSLSRSRDDHLVQDLESALRLAQQQTDLTGSAQPLISALQAADARIARAAQPRLNPVQRAIARDLDRIQATPVADVPTAVQVLDELVRQVDDWPLLNRVGTQEEARSLTPAGPPQRPEGQSDEGTADAHDQPAAWARVSTWWRGWWQRAWSEMTRSGRELVRVSRIDTPEAALLAPDQAFFLRENLKLQLLNARLSLLARHNASARADLAAVEQALKTFFDGGVPMVASARRTLAGLSEDLVGHELPRADDTLAALAVAAGGR
ncbi:MAG TPA: uroporphyrinogen-III C-methyltransferase [Hydrogenophaga sp.]|uniref:uroporphyrinogen-III C-methyltransferase n=1 Tax=Hydrogenophaga sp. TaxID=1904254 RepID=UPI002CAD491E|nr:uroporphyrinogen-III C-methyltransferase [Hydrogenophaga sp.]HMN93544.1 uroporphyrinogen-III C-methyltransferase [Hydrogenophaga sp.]HMP10259.1 uroporphyrinogen-III C-methyltransferase [Hydrogenophaga sp.]